jgi:hypothetical protein
MLVRHQSHEACQECGIDLPCVFGIARELKSFLCKRSLVSYRSITASGVERLYRLQGSGIPVEMIPITDSGKVKRAYLYQWIKVRKIIESKDNVENRDYGNSIILLSGSNDVLIRTGTTTLSHPGNVFFRGLTEMKHKEFRSAEKVVDRCR